MAGVDGTVAVEAVATAADAAAEIDPLFRPVVVLLGATVVVVVFVGWYLMGVESVAVLMDLEVEKSEEASLAGEAWATDRLRLWPVAVRLEAATGDEVAVVDVLAEESEAEEAGARTAAPFCRADVCAAGG